MARPAGPVNDTTMEWRAASGLPRGESSPPLLHLFVEQLLERLIGPPAACHHLGTPRQVLLAAIPGPEHRRPLDDIAHVGNLVCQLDELRTGRSVRGMIDLPLLAHGPRERLVVGHLRDNRADLRAESFPDLVEGNPRVLDHVVEDRCGEHDRVRDASGVGDQVGNRDRVVDVRRPTPIFAALIAMPVCCEVQCPQQQ